MSQYKKHFIPHTNHRGADVGHVPKNNPCTGNALITKNSVYGRIPLYYIHVHNVIDSMIIMYVFLRSKTSFLEMGDAILFLKFVHGIHIAAYPV